MKGTPIAIIPRKRIHKPNMGHNTINDKKLIKLNQDIIKNLFIWLYDCDVMFDNKKSYCNRNQPNKCIMLLVRGWF